MLEVLGARVTDRHHEFSEWKKGIQFVGETNAEQEWYDAMRAYEVVQEACLKCERCSETGCDNKVMISTWSNYTTCTPEATALMKQMCADCIGHDDEDEMWFKCPNCGSLGGGFDVGSNPPRGVDDTQCIHCESTVACMECRARPVFEAGEDLCKFCVDN